MTKLKSTHWIKVNQQMTFIDGILTVPFTSGTTVFLITVFLEPVIYPFLLS